MKIDQLLICFLVLFNTISFAQEIERVEVNGRIIVDRNDVEGVTVYNHSSQTGTVTDKEGNFVINVAINDRVEFGALQFQNFTIITFINAESSAQRGRFCQNSDNGGFAIVDFTISTVY